MPPRGRPKKQSSSSTAAVDDKKTSRSKRNGGKTTKHGSNKNNLNTAENTSMITKTDDEDFYFNLWGQEVNQDLMQYILDFVPVYPDLLNMRATSKFWKFNLETVFFPKVQVLDLLTRGKDHIEIFKNNKLAALASYFPNIVKLRMCQPGWNIFFKQANNKIETLEFYDLECVVVATSFSDFCEELMDCHKSNKHAPCLKMVNIYGTSDSGYYQSRKITNYFNGKLQKGQTALSSLQAINLKYYSGGEQTKKLVGIQNISLEKPISEYDNVVEFWDKMVFEENINWTLLQPFNIVEPLNNEDLFDLIIEYSKAQDIPIRLLKNRYRNNSSRYIADSDLVFDEFYKKFVDNPDLDPHLRYKFDYQLLDEIFTQGNSHLLLKIIENNNIPLIVEKAENPLIELLNNNEMALFRKALAREPSLINLGNSSGIIDGNRTEMNLLYHFIQHLSRSSFSYRALPSSIISILKYLIEIGVDINHTNDRGCLLNLFRLEHSSALLPLFEDIKLETLERKNSNGMSAIEVWAKQTHQYYESAVEFLKFFESVYKKHGKNIRDHVIHNGGGNLLHAMSTCPYSVYEYCFEQLKMDVTQRNDQGVPALFCIHPASWNEKLINQLKKDSVLDVRDVNGRTLLSISLTEKPMFAAKLVDPDCGGCDLEYALSKVEFREEFPDGFVLESKNGQSLENGAKYLLYSAFKNNRDWLNVFLEKNSELLSKCLEVEITIRSTTNTMIDQVVMTPAHVFSIMGFWSEKLARLNLATGKHYFFRDAIALSDKYKDEVEGEINWVGLGSIIGKQRDNKYFNKDLLEEKSSITQLNSWMLAAKYGHYEIVKNLLNYLGKPMEECESVINELAQSNLQYHILGDALKLKLQEKKLVGDDVKLLSGFIFNFTEFGDFSDIIIDDDLLNSNTILEQKCIRHIVKRNEPKLEHFWSNHYAINSSDQIKMIGELYNRIHQVTYQLTMLEVCVLKGYPLKKVLDSYLKTDKDIAQFLSRREKNTKKPFIHLLCDTSLLIYIGVEKRELHNYKHSILVSLLSNLSSASKKQVLNLLDSNNETPIFGAVRGGVKNLVKSLAPNTNMSIKNLQGKTCLDISNNNSEKHSDMNNILIQYADKKTLANKRQSELVEEEAEKTTNKKKQKRKK